VIAGSDNFITPKAALGCVIPAMIAAFWYSSAPRDQIHRLRDRGRTIGEIDPV
jgi:hypothetical protein